MKSIKIGRNNDLMLLVYIKNEITNISDDITKQNIIKCDVEYCQILVIQNGNIINYHQIDWQQIIDRQKRNQLHRQLHTVAMFIKYLLRQQILIPASEYTVSAQKAIKNCIFRRYLFRIIRCIGCSSQNNESDEVICVKIESIQIIDNIILRKSGEMKVKVVIGILVLRLMDGQYFEGVVERCNGQGIVVKFIGGLMEGTIGIKNMHKDTIYNQDKNQWIYTAQNLGNEGYEWKIGAKVRFKIHSTHWSKVYQGPETGRPAMADLVELRADELGLGPAQWWL